MEETKQKLIPAIIQDYLTGEVLMLAYMNDESLKKTLETGTTWFWSRSRQKFWNKGETSGNTQIVKELRYDCDDDTYLVLVEQTGDTACHTGNRTCFYRTMFTAEGYDKQQFSPKDKLDSDVIDSLYKLIRDRQSAMPEKSYTADLFRAGVEKILEKIEEESDEVIEAAREKDNAELVWEVSDLVYHLLVLLAARDIPLAAVAEELLRRGKPS